MAESIVAQTKRKKQCWKRYVRPMDKYGRLTVLEEVNRYVFPSGQKQRKFKCLCECGNVVSVILSSLISGNTVSCGCFSREESSKRLKTHGFKGHPLYGVWGRMLQRCSNPGNKDYQDYGRRGISVCNEWAKDASSFIEWALVNGWEKGLFIDRIDVDRGYTPENVRFVDVGLSARNKQVLQANNTSGYVGVSYKKQSKKWKAYLRGDGVQYCIGSFKTAIEAAKARDKKAIELNMGHPLNFNLQQGE